MSTQRRPSVRIGSFPGLNPTVRELEVLHLAGMGLSMKSTAKALGISSGTVKWHLKNLYQKLGAGSREEALRIARARHLIESRLFCPGCAGVLADRKPVPVGLNLLHH